MFFTDRPKIGLALSGGSAKGFAHIGVIKVLEEAGIPIDYIAGTSMGSIVGAFYATGKNIREIERIATTLDRKQLMQLIDFAFKGGLLSGEKLYAFIKTNLAGTTFEECKIPLSVIATDLKTSEPVVFRKGDLWPALRASISIPSIFAPVAHENALLADGGLCIPLPARIVRDMGADIVIAVNVMAHRDVRPMQNLTGIRGFVAVANASLDIMMHHLARYDEESADVVIAPDTSAFASYGYDQAQPIIESGATAAREVLPRVTEAIEAKTSVLSKLSRRFRSLRRQ
jgi:NTE family protein